MSEVCVYIAVSLDGFIATEEGGVGWLDAFIGAELVGHTVYRQIRECPRL